MGRIFEAGRVFEDTAGRIVADGKLHFYTTNTTTRKNTFSDSAETTANANPITLGSDGRTPAEIFGSGTYTVTLKDVNGATVWSNDDVKPANTADAADVTFTPSWGTAERSVEDVLNTNVFNVLDYAPGVGAGSDDRDAIQGTIDHAESNGGGVVWFPPQSQPYLISDFIKVTDPGVVLKGGGGYLGDIYHATDASQITPYGSVIKLMDGSTLTEHSSNTGDYPIIWFQYTGTDTGARWGGGIEHLVIWGNRVKTGGTAPNLSTATDNNANGIGLYLEGIRNAHFKNMLIAHCADKGMKTVTGTVGVAKSFGGSTFVACAFHANGDEGARMSGGDTAFTDCSFGFNGSNGLYMNGGKIVNGCRFWDNFAHGIQMDGGSDLTVIGSQAYDNQGAGIKVAVNEERFAIIGCTTQDNGKDSTTYTDAERAGVYVNGPSYGIVSDLLTSNKQEDGLTSGQEYGIYVQDSASVVHLHNIRDGIVAGSSSTNPNATALIENEADSSALTIASGVITVTQDKHTVTVETASSPDDLDTINGGFLGQELTLSPSDSNDDVILRDDTGNMKLRGDFAMGHSQDYIRLRYDGNNWHELWRTNTGNGFPVYTRTGPGAIDLGYRVVYIVTTGADDAITLAAGVPGQEMHIVMTTDGGDGVLTCSNLLDAASNIITFSNANDWVDLRFINSKWVVVAQSATTPVLS